MDESAISELIKEKKVIDQETLQNILYFFEPRSLENNPSICNFLMTKTTADQIREKDLLQLLYENIIVYVLNYEEYNNVEGFTKEELTRKFSRLFQEAKKTFQQSNPNTGEIGEIILFLLLEAQNIIQVISKMRLKTSGEMPVHGSDAIHVQIDENGNIVFHFGESKMYQSFDNALNSATESIENLDNKENLDVNLIRRHIDASKFGIYTEQLVNLLDPYFPDKEKLAYAYPVFIGFDWNKLNDLSQKGNSSLSDYLQKEYSNQQETFLKKINNKIQESKIKNKKLAFYLLPFKNVKDFRNAFIEMM